MRCFVPIRVLTLLILSACTGVVEPSDPDFETPESGVTGDGTDSGSASNPGASPLHQAALDVMAANCLACHDGEPSEFNGTLDLSPASIEEFADRLVNMPSSIGGCDGERLVDAESVDDSLLLTLVDSNTARDAECIGKMPLGTDGLSDEDYDVLREWALELLRIGSSEPNPLEDTLQQTTADASPVAPLNALRKAKMLATGQVPTQAELDAVTDQNGELDDDAFSILVDGWVRADNNDYVAKRNMFLRSVLQQNGSIGKTNRQLVLTKLNDRHAAKFYPNLNDMYVKTAEWIADEDADFRTLFTDDWAMVTTGALVMMQMADWPVVRHKFGGMTRDFNTQGFKYTLELYNDDTAQMDSDTSDWRLVRLTYEADPAQHSRDVTPFYNGDIITQMRAVGEGDQVALRVPRTICSSIAFFTAWETNLDNKFRGPMNQCVILALNSSFSPHDLTSHPDPIPPGLDPEEFPLDSTCYGCHKNMEPAVSAYTQHFDVSHNRYVGYTQSEVDDYNALREEYVGLDPEKHGGWMKIPATPPDPLLIYEGVNTSVADLKDWVRQLGLHPGFAKAWVMKFAQWALSEPVDPNDPEVAVLAEAFEESGFRFHALVRAFLVSKFVTHGTSGDDANFAGNSVSLLRQDHFCHSMQVRLRDIRLGENRTSDTPGSRTDLCGFNAGASRALPKGGSDRGAIELTLPKQSDAFSQISLEQLCNTAGEELVGNGSATFLRSPDDLDNTVGNLVAGLLGFPESSPEHAEAKESFVHLYGGFTASPECETGEDFEAALAEETPSCGLNLAEQLAMETIVSVACQDPRTTSIGL